MLSTVPTPRAAGSLVSQAKAVLHLQGKAHTLQACRPLVKTARVPPLVRSLASEWIRNPKAEAASVVSAFGRDALLIVRSSKAIEDSHAASHAGQYASVQNVRGEAALLDAIVQVLESYGTIDAADEIMVQQQVENVRMAGVVFTRDLHSGAPYLLINYDDESGLTDQVTGGTSNRIKQFVHAHGGPLPANLDLQKVAALCAELSVLTAEPALDIEFAIDKNDVVYLLQVRPLAIRSGTITTERHTRLLRDVHAYVAGGIRRKPYLSGSKTIYGVMPDWNPAEIIGLRPHPLALSLYRDLITDAIWAYQRDNYGYRKLRGHPLLVSLHGLPYIDVRLSFNSFLPKELDDDVAERLIDDYISQLEAKPHLHDKVEFGIAYTCFTFDLRDRLQPLSERGFSSKEIFSIHEALRSLTYNIIHSKDARGWRDDLARTDELQNRREVTLASNQSLLEKAYWLLEDCKRYGTLPFCGLARAGFIAVQMLDSLVAIDVLSESNRTHFMESLNTVSTQMERDFANLSREKFLQRYGHLRPGTYDITSPRYDEAPELYFRWEENTGSRKRKPPAFKLKPEQMQAIDALLRQYRLDCDASAFFDFLRTAIEAREMSKFHFTRNLSDALSLLRRLGESFDFSAEDMSYMDVRLVQETYVCAQDIGQEMRDSIEQGRRRFKDTCHILLPPLIGNPEQIWNFHYPEETPNFIGSSVVVADVAMGVPGGDISGKIVCIPNADPGFDWIFSYPIAGLITAYGGANSHMAIRAAERGLPAVIGAGKVLFEKWGNAHKLEIDAQRNKVTVIQA